MQLNEIYTQKILGVRFADTGNLLFCNGVQLQRIKIIAMYSRCVVAFETYLALLVITVCQYLEGVALMFLCCR